MNKKQLIVICVSIVLMVLSGCDEQLSRVGSGMKDLKNAREVKLLDGTWEIIFDDENVGRDTEWHIDKVFSGQSAKRKITVPSAWELIEKDYEGVAFYRHSFKVPANWKGKVIRLQFDAVNYLCEVWLNDEVVGFHEGGFTPFEFRVDEMIKPGATNVLTVRVVGPIILSDKR